MLAKDIIKELKKFAPDEEISIGVKTRSNFYERKKIIDVDSTGTILCDALELKDIEKFTNKK